ncbi:hypothetical protein AX16_005741 [Volvariella volvacea WC 439]|nr:hypothetical protein AX16_005741 [Volvariella volvacea WC 439]
MARLLDLPPELLLSIVTHLASSTADLFSASTTCRALAAPCQFQLFRELHLRDPAQPTASLIPICQKFNRLLEDSPHISNFVRTLKIDLAPFQDWFHDPSELCQILRQLDSVSTISITCPFQEMLDWSTVPAEVRGAFDSFIARCADSIQAIEVKYMLNFPLHILQRLSHLRRLHLVGITTHLDGINRGASSDLWFRSIKVERGQLSLHYPNDTTFSLTMHPHFPFGAGTIRTLELTAWGGAHGSGNALIGYHSGSLEHLTMDLSSSVLDLSSLKVLRKLVLQINVHGSMTDGLDDEASKRIFLLADTLRTAPKSQAIHLKISLNVRGNRVPLIDSSAWSQVNEEIVSPAFSSVIFKGHTFRSSGARLQDQLNQQILENLPCLVKIKGVEPIWRRRDQLV